MTTAEWLLLMRSMARVLANSERTDEIHRVEELTGRKIYRRILPELRSNPDGEALLRDRPELRSDMVSYNALRELPRGTLGGAYVRHLDDYGLSADYQAAPTRHINDEEMAYWMRRFRQTHDVWHAVVGLGAQPHEEVILHAFSWGQLKLPVSGLIVALGSLKHIVLESRWMALRHGLLQAYESGRDAHPLLPVYWEKHWDEPLDQVRERYGIRPASPQHVYA